MDGGGEAPGLEGTEPGRPDAVQPVSGELPSQGAEADRVAATNETDDRPERSRGGRERGRRPRRDDAPMAPQQIELEAGAASASMVAEEVARQDVASAPEADFTPPRPRAEPFPAMAPAMAAVPAAVPQPAIVPTFVLPMESLQAVAAASGLEWVNSDAEKIRVVQAAMAAEPQPVHVPRERKPVVKIDEGPLVLVETRKDLSQIKLPFEAAELH
jgi:ribonuclease E